MALYFCFKKYLQLELRLLYYTINYEISHTIINTLTVHTVCSNILFVFEALPTRVTISTWIKAGHLNIRPYILNLKWNNKYWKRHASHLVYTKRLTGMPATVKLCLKTLSLLLPFNTESWQKICSYLSLITYFNIVLEIGDDILMSKNWTKCRKKLWTGTATSSAMSN